MCIKLLGVARGFVRELLEDYQDFLRQHEMEIWTKGDSRTITTRNYCRNNFEIKGFVEKCKQRSNETIANIMITLIRQIDAMLAKVLKGMEEEFIKEAMSRARRKSR